MSLKRAIDYVTVLPHHLLMRVFNRSIWHIGDKAALPFPALILAAVILVLTVALVPAVAGCSAGDDGADLSQSTVTIEASQSIEQEAAAAIAGPAGAADSPSYSFAVCGDNRSMGIQNGVLGRIVESARSRGADFIVDVGDITENGSIEQIALYRDFIESAGIRFYTVPGNHDLGPGLDARYFQDMIGPRYYGFDYAGDHFLVVDNADTRVGIDEAQLAWLTDDLENNSGKDRLFVFAHVPMNDSAGDHVEFAGERTTSPELRFLEAARAQENLAAFFFGHVHGYIAYRIGDIDAFVTGGGGAPLNPAPGIGFYHYLLVTVSPGGVTVEVVRV